MVAGSVGIRSRYPYEINGRGADRLDPVGYSTWEERGFHTASVETRSCHIREDAQAATRDTRVTAVRVQELRTSRAPPTQSGSPAP